MVACLALGRFRFHLPTLGNTFIHSKTQQLWSWMMKWETFAFQVQILILTTGFQSPVHLGGVAQKKGSLKAGLTNTSV